MNLAFGLILSAAVCAAAEGAAASTLRNSTATDDGSQSSIRTPPELAVDLERESHALTRLRERLARIEEQIEKFRKARRSTSWLSKITSQGGPAETPETYTTDTIRARRIATPEGFRYDVSAKEAPGIRVFEGLSTISGLPLQVHPDVGQRLLQRRIWLELQGSDLSEILEITAGLLSLDMLVDENGIVVGPITALSDQPIDRRLRDMAVEAYQRALLRYPASFQAPWAYMGIARHYEASGFHAPAIQVAQNVLDRYADSAACGDAILLIGQCHEAVGDLAAARGFYHQFIDSYVAAENVPNVLLQIAQTWMREGDHIQAKAVLEEVIRGWPSSTAVMPARLRLAECLVRQNRYDRAMTQLQLAESSPSESQTPGEVDFMMAECLMKLGRYAEARSRLSRVVRTAEASALAEKGYYALGDCLLAEKNPVEALEAYRGAMLAFPQGALKISAPLRICRAYLQMELYREVEQTLKQATHAAWEHPGMRDVLIALARHFLETGDHQKVMALTSDPRRWMDSDGGAEVVILQAGALLSARMPEQALEKARSAARLTSDETLKAEAYLLIGKCKARMKEPVSAAMAFGGKVE